MFDKFAAKLAISAAKDKAKAATSMAPRTDDQGRDTEGGILWYERNYPPLLNVFHFDPKGDNIPLAARARVKWMHWTFRFCLGQFILNLAATIIIGASGGRSSLNILPSLIELIAGSLLVGYTLYNGYRGMAADVAKFRFRYKVLQGGLIIVWVVFLFVSSGNIHGLAGISSSNQAIVNVFCLLEPFIWAAVIIMSVISIGKVHTYKGHAAYYEQEKIERGLENMGKKPVKKAEPTISV